ncbi:MAG: AI-2E family transporter [Terriglobales bacterium]
MANEAHKKRLIFLAVLIAALLFLALDMVRPFLRPLTLASVIALGCYPLHAWLQRRIHKPDWAALVTTLIVFLGVAVPAFVLTYLISGELSHIAEHISDQSTREGGFLAYLQHGQERFLAWAAQYVDVEQFHIRQRVSELPERASGFLLSMGSSIAGSAVNGITDGIFTFVFLFFFFRDGAKWLEGLAKALPLRPENVQRLYGAVHSSVVATLYGLVGVALAQGLLTGLGLRIAGIDNFLMLGMLAAVCSVIPVIGTSLVWGPAAVYLLVTHHTGKAIFLLIWGAAVVSMADNIIRPMVLRGKVQVHILLLIFAILGGLLTFGFVGLFLGPVIFSLLATLLPILREEMGEERGESPQAG